jgi:hypothetical protein
MAFICSSALNRRVCAWNDAGSFWMECFLWYLQQLRMAWPVTKANSDCGLSPSRVKAQNTAPGLDMLGLAELP